MTRLRTLLLAALLLASLFVPSKAWAHLPIQLFQGAEQHVSGVIRKLPEGFDPEAFPRMPGGLYRMPPEFKLEVEVLSGAHRGQVVTVDYFLTGNPSVDVVPTVGERVILGESRLANGRLLHVIIEYDRRPALAWMTVLSMLTLLGVGVAAGLRTVAFLALAAAALYAVVLSLLIQGAPPSLVSGLGALGLAAGAILLALPRAPERVAALAGSAAGVVVALTALSLSFQVGHVSGLATPDALVLYSQAMSFRSLDFQQLWVAGTLLTTLGGIVLGSVLTARAIARETDDAWQVGLREARALLPALALFSGLLYFGLSLSLLLISQLDQISSLQVSIVRLLNYDYLVSVILAWEAGLMSLVATLLATSAAARFLRARRHAT